MEQDAQSFNRLLRWPEVRERVGLSHSQVYKLMNQAGPDGRPAFPQVVKLGQRASGWIESEVEAWIDERIQASRSNGGANHVA